MKEEDVKGKAVLEVGALDVGGSVRPIVEELVPGRYVGVDLEMGRGVDIICDASNLCERFGRHAFDLLICTEVLEHVTNWRAAIENIKNVLAPGGVLLLTTRSNGFPFHGYPYDYWRYETAGMGVIFSDLDIQVLEEDPQAPGVFLKARKPQGFCETDLKDYSLYSIITNRRSIELTQYEIRKFKVQYALAQILPDRLKQFIKRRILGRHT